MSELARREDSLSELAGRANRTLAALDVDGAGPLDRALAALPGPLETLRDRGQVLDALIDRTGELAVELRPALRELAPALDELQPVLAASPRPRGGRCRSCTRSAPSCDARPARPRPSNAC